jgi:hypothetical protein
MGKKRRALAEEDRKGSTSKVDHRVLAVLAFSSIGKREEGFVEHSAQFLVDLLATHRHEQPAGFPTGLLD